MKKSKAITLVLIAGALFIGCEEKVRNQYGSWDDCVKDYKDSKGCQEEKKKDSSGTFHAYYYGPWYHFSSSSNTSLNPSAKSGRAIGVARGGWGFHGGHAAS